jgi:hypothetical protein
MGAFRSDRPGGDQEEEGSMTRAVTGATPGRLSLRGRSRSAEGYPVRRDGAMAEAVKP